MGAGIGGRGGMYGAGIGGGWLGGGGEWESVEEDNGRAHAGTIVISGGKVNAAGGKSAVGIGGGAYSSNDSGSIMISGGEVIAVSERNGAGIGGGYYASGGVITISGGTVTAQGGYEAAGISSGNATTAVGGVPFVEDISGGAITISGGSVKDHRRHVRRGHRRRLERKGRRHQN